MSKYKELAKLAEMRAREVFAEREVARRYAHQIVVGYQQYLECEKSPDYVVLDDKLRTTQEKETISKRAPVQPGRDGSWLFAFSIRLEGDFAWMDEKITVTLRISQDRLKVESDRSFEYDLGRDPAFNDFFEYLYRDAKRRLEDGKYARAIGFHAKHD